MPRSKQATPENTTSDSPSVNISRSRYNNTFGARVLNRTQNNTNNTHLSISRDLEGATPKIGGVLAPRSKHMHKKTSYDTCCERLSVYVMNKFRNGDLIV